MKVLTVTPWEMYERVLWALTIWREASNQPHEARVAVAHAIKNRVDRPSWWGRNIIEVLTKREQFTSINTATNDPNLRRWPVYGDKVFLECLDIVEGVVMGVYGPVFKGADSYYDDSIPAPYWAKKHPERYLGKSGAFIFYNMDQDIEKVTA